MKLREASDKGQQHFKCIPVIGDSSQTACFHPHQSGQMRTSHWGVKKEEEKNIIHTCWKIFQFVKIAQKRLLWKQKTSFWTGLCVLVNKGVIFVLEKEDPQDRLSLQISTQNPLSST